MSLYNKFLTVPHKKSIAHYTSQTKIVRYFFVRKKISLKDILTGRFFP